MRRRVSGKSFGKGAFTGYGDYRYGEERPVYAPGKDPISRSLLKGERREHVVGRVTEQMRQWKASPFEFEGPIRAGLRSGMCLDGVRWPLADIVAADIVAEALQNINARRPTWEQGQRGWTEPREQCVSCGKPVADTHVGAKGYRFCSEVCAQAAREKAAFEHRQHTDRLYAAAARVINRSRTKPRSCLQCGETFHPVREASTQQFCSQQCGATHRSLNSRYTLADKPRSCVICGERFMAKKPDAKYCGKTCMSMNQKLQAGRIPQKLKRRVFDHFFTMPINLSTGSLTPERFDYLLESA